MPASATQGLARVKILKNSRLTKKVSGLATTGQRTGAHLLEVRTYGTDYTTFYAREFFSPFIQKGHPAADGSQKSGKLQFFTIIFSLPLAPAILLLSQTFVQVSAQRWAYSRIY
jgi:hypothetical protein